MLYPIYCQYNIHASKIIEIGRGGQDGLMSACCAVDPGTILEGGIFLRSRSPFKFQFISSVHSTNILKLSQSGSIGPFGLATYSIEPIVCV